MKPLKYYFRAAYGLASIWIVNHLMGGPAIVNFPDGKKISLYPGDTLNLISEENP